MKIKKQKILYLIPLLILMIISLCTLYKVDILNISYQNYFKKQVAWYILSFSLSIIIFIKKERLFKHAFIIYLINLFLLLLVLFINKKVNGSSAWINLGFISFQPSEFMKISLILYLSKFISKYYITDFKSEFILILKVIIITLVPAILTFLEPDTGAVIIYFVIAFSLLLTCKIRKKWFLYIALIILLFLGIFLLIYNKNTDLFIKIFGTSFFYRIDRIIYFFGKNPLQLENALVSIGSAGFLGYGIANIPLNIIEAPTDFAFSLLATKLGLFGLIILLMTYLFLYYALVKELNNAKTMINKLFITGLFSMMLFQCSYNILMNIGLLPIMGITLPFVSYGGSSLITYFIIYYLFINIVKN